VPTNRKPLRGLEESSGWARAINREPLRGLLMTFVAAKQIRFDGVLVLEKGLEFVLSAQGGAHDLGAIETEATFLNTRVPFEVEAFAP